MSSRWRITLALAGLAIIVVSTLILLYVIWPVEPMIERFQPPPTLFVAPGPMNGCDTRDEGTSAAPVGTSRRAECAMARRVHTGRPDASGHHKPSRN